MRLARLRRHHHRCCCATPTHCVRHAPAKNQSNFLPPFYFITFLDWKLVWPQSHSVCVSFANYSPTVHTFNHLSVYNSHCKSNLSDHEHKSSFTQEHEHKFKRSQLTSNRRLGSNYGLNEEDQLCQLLALNRIKT